MPRLNYHQYTWYDRKAGVYRPINRVDMVMKEEDTTPPEQNIQRRTIR